jgi:multiple sugar transport system permease protein
MGIIGSFQVFTQAFIMTGGGPLRSTLFYMLHLYNSAFLYFKMGYASAMAVVLFFIILVLTLFVNQTSERWVHYT